MDFKMHHRGEDEKAVWAKHTVDLLNPLLGIGKMFEGFKVQYQSNALIGNRLHVCNITNHVNAGRIEVPHVLFNIPFPWKEGLVKIWFPSCTRIEDGFPKRETLSRPFYIVDNRFSQRDLLPCDGPSIIRVRIEKRRGAQTSLV